MSETPRMRPLWTVMPALDELGRRQLDHGLAILRWLRGDRSRPLPTSPVVPLHAVVLRRVGDVLEVLPDAVVSQLTLAQAASSMAGIGCVVSNHETGASLANLPLHVRMLGWWAFRSGPHFAETRYVAPLVYRREDQRFALGFDALLAAVGSEDLRRFSLSELFQFSRGCIEPTLSGEEASRFFWEYLK